MSPIFPALRNDSLRSRKSCLAGQVIMFTLIISLPGAFSHRDGQTCRPSWDPPQIRRANPRIWHLRYGRREEQKSPANVLEIPRSSGPRRHPFGEGSSRSLCEALEQSRAALTIRPRMDAVDGTVHAVPLTLHWLRTKVSEVKNQPADIFLLTPVRGGDKRFRRSKTPRCKLGQELFI